MAHAFGSNRTCCGQIGAPGMSVHARPSSRLCFARPSTQLRSGRQRRQVVTASAEPLKVIIMGAPAAGKGTQCERIVTENRVVHISVGDLLRAEVAANTPDGVRARQFMDAGQLVPNEVVVDMVKHRLAQPDVAERGWLLDGYPRSAEQAAAIEEADIRPDVFLLINVADKLLVDRIVGRRSDPVTGTIYHLTHRPPPEDIIDRLVQRSDDTEEMAVARLKTYHSNVDSVLGYYKDILVEVDGEKDMDTVYSEIQEALSSLKTRGAQERQVATA